MDDNIQDFEQFMRRREAAALAFVNGDADPLGQITAQAADATFFGPRGDYYQGAEQVSSVYKRDSALFESGETTLEIFHMSASDSVGYWVGLQRATVRLKGQNAPVNFDLRVTEVFRKEHNEWKLVHRHADPLKTPPE